MCQVHDAVTLEAQLAEARSSNARLQGEVEKLNDTVFSKTFRAPSAWAEREVKYKMEKKDWDTQVDPPALLLAVNIAPVRIQHCSQHCDSGSRCPVLIARMGYDARSRLSCSIKHKACIQSSVLRPQLDMRVCYR